MPRKRDDRWKLAQDCKRAARELGFRDGQILIRLYARKKLRGQHPVQRMRIEHYEDLLEILELKKPPPGWMHARWPGILSRYRARGVL